MDMWPGVTNCICNTQREKQNKILKSQLVSFVFYTLVPFSFVNLHILNWAAVLQNPLHSNGKNIKRHGCADKFLSFLQSTPPLAWELQASWFRNHSAASPTFGESSSAEVAREQP